MHEKARLGFLFAPTTTRRSRRWGPLAPRWECRRSSTSSAPWRTRLRPRGRSSACRPRVMSPSSRMRCGRSAPSTRSSCTATGPTRSPSAARRSCTRCARISCGVHPHPGELGCRPGDGRTCAVAMPTRTPRSAAGPLRRDAAVPATPCWRTRGRALRRRQGESIREGSTRGAGDRRREGAPHARDGGCPVESEMNRLLSIVERKRVEVATASCTCPWRARVRLAELPACRALAGTLSVSGGPIRVIAEIKRASPSAGVIGPDMESPHCPGPTGIAGRARSRFSPTPSVLAAASTTACRARQVTAAISQGLHHRPLPARRGELRGSGCGAAHRGCAARGQLQDLHAAALGLGLEVLVEAHDEAELEIANGVENWRLIGLNSRNLDTFDVDLAMADDWADDPSRRSWWSRKRHPLGPRTCRGCAPSGFANFLVGEALVRSSGPAARC